MDKKLTEQETNKIFGDNYLFKLTVMMTDLNKPEGRELIGFIIRHCKGNMNVNKLGEKVEIKFIIRDSLRDKIKKMINKEVFSYYDLCNKRMINENYIKNSIK